MKKDVLEWKFPLSRTHCGIPLGNGMFGALVWGKGNRLYITVSRSDSWDHRGGQRLEEGETYEKLRAAYDPADPAKLEAVFHCREWKKGSYATTRLPGGRFDFQLKPNCRLAEARLNLKNGLLTVAVKSEKIGKTTKITIFLGVSRDILWLEDSGLIIEKVRARPSWEWLSEELIQYRFRPPDLVSEKNLCGWVQSYPADPALAALCLRADKDFVICLSRDLPEKPARSVGLAEIGTGLQQGREAVLAENESWWKNYWRRSPKISLPDKFFDSFLRFALYKFACATNPHSVTPAAIQGPWIEEYRLPPWSGDYHFNVNIQQIYTLAFSGNHSAHLLPLFDMLDSCRSLFQQNAWFLFGIEDGLLIPHATDDRGYAAGGISAGSVIDQAVSGWTAQLYWLYYQSTGDREFLRRRAYPFLEGVMRCYEEMLEKKNGLFHLPISISAEYQKFLPDGKAQPVGRNPSYQFACIHMLTDALLEASRILHEKPREIWLEIKQKLPAWTLIEEPGLEKTVSSEGGPHIALWEGQDLEMTHRHHAHLACIYPFDSLGTWTPEKEQIIEDSILRWVYIGTGDWSEWCLPWAAIIHSRLGHTEDPMLLLEIWRRIFLNEGLCSVYVPRSFGLTVHRKSQRNLPLSAEEPRPLTLTDVGSHKRIFSCNQYGETMQLDGTMAAATALHEMLAHNRSGVTRIFPGAPKEWADIYFKNIRVPGPFLVSAEKKAGRVMRVAVKALQPGRITLDLPNCAAKTFIRLPDRKRITLPATFEMKQAERIELVTDGQ